MERRKALIKSFKRPVVLNKRNNQLSMTISRKLLGLKKGEKPKKMKFDFKGFDF